jgi:hypothetical protein
MSDDEDARKTEGRGLSQPLTSPPSQAITPQNRSLAAAAGAPNPFYPAPAGPYAPPPPPVPGSTDEAFEVGRRCGFLFGEKFGWAKKVYQQLQEGIVGESKGKASPWNKLPPDDRATFLNNVLKALSELPMPPEYATRERRDAAERGFREGAQKGLASAAIEAFTLWFATEMAIAVVTGALTRLPASAARITVGPSGARLGRTLASTEMELQRASEEAYQAIRQSGKAQIPTIASNSGIGESTLSDLFDHIFIKEHALAAEPNVFKTARFEADPVIARLWQKARTGPLSGSDLTKFKDVMARSCGNAIDEGWFTLSFSIPGCVVKDDR